jgi:hypothetical protein
VFGFLGSSAGKVGVKRTSEEGFRVVECGGSERVQSKAKQSNQYIQSGRGNGEGGRGEEELRGRVKGWVNDRQVRLVHEKSGRGDSAGENVEP